MELKIDEKTKWDEICLLLTEDDFKELQKKVTDIFPFDFYQITIGDLAQMSYNPPKFPNVESYDQENITVFDYFKIKNANDFVIDFTNDLKNYELSKTIEESNANSNLPDFTLIEVMLCFTQSYFNLQNFGEAEKITLLEYLLARKNDYTQKLYEKNLTNEFTRKSRRVG